MNDGKARQQIVDKIKSSSNILVTVSTNPSVDELSAALGLTLLLNKMDKHATAVFSGGIPPAITFLDPQKTFENTVDSLRDFIIALDKEKADHLRYKVDGDVVKIFITPYRTTISSDDLDFSQGDYNVELVLALGVKDQDHLDGALAAHGRILHDATVVTVNVDNEKSDLGTITWNEANASSLSELLVTLSDGLKKNDQSLLDEQIATAFLTGVVASTDRFSNSKTTSRAMTIAAQLMAAGANQQLIASELQQANEIGQTDQKQDETPDDQNGDGTTNLSEGKSTKLDKNKSQKKPESRPEPESEQDKPKNDGSLVISHEKRGDVDEVGRQTAAEQQKAAAKVAEDKLAEQLAQEGENAVLPAPVAEPKAPMQTDEALAEELASVTPRALADTPSVADLQKDIAAASNEVEEAAQQAPPTVEAPVVAPEPTRAENKIDAPTMGGTLNATTEQAAEDARRATEADRNRTILSHGGEYVQGETPAFQSPINAAAQPDAAQPQSVDPFKNMAPVPPLGAEQINKAPTVEPSTQPMTLAEIDQQNRSQQADDAQHDTARAAVEAALSGAPDQSLPPVFAPQSQQDLFASAPEMPGPNLPPPPPMPDFSSLPPLPAMPEASAPQLPTDEKLGDILTPAPAPTQPPVPTDPGQFRIPGQN